MTEPQTFILADRTLNDVVQAITDDQWDMPMPATFQTTAEGPVTLRQVIAYHAYDEAWIPSMVQGRKMAEVGEETFDGDILGDDPKGRFAALVDAACEAVGNVTDLDATMHFSYGDWPMREGLWHLISFRGLRAYDLAKVLGQPTGLPDELVQAMWDGFSPRADEWRTMGVFQPAVDVPEDAPLQDRLMALTGRDPS